MKPLEEMGKYKTVVIDPPWKLGLVGWAKSHDNGIKELPPYAMMTNEELEEFPVPEVLDDDAMLFCWTVNSHIDVAKRLVQHWGCKYSYTMVWHKPGGPQYPNGPQFNAEFVVIGRKGKPKFLSTRAFRLCNYWKRSGGHSAKPEEFYELLRRVTPAPRLDIFGRRRIGGFTSWGDEAPDEEENPGVYQELFT